MRGLFGLFGGRNGQETASEASRLRLEGLADDVYALRKEVERLQAREVAVLASVHEATDKLKRAIERARKSRPPHRDRGDDGDAGDDWLGGYYALRGRGAGTAPARPLIDDSEDEEAEE